MRRVRGSGSFVVEERPEGATLAVTAPWDGSAASVLERGEVDALDLNYARGFLARDLEFLDGAWPLRRLHVLDRSLRDLEPIGRLGGTLETLTVQAAPEAEIDLAALPRLATLRAYWDDMRGTLRYATGLRDLMVLEYAESDLTPLAENGSLRSLVLKVAMPLESTSGVTELAALQALEVIQAPRLEDFEEVAELGPGLVKLEFEACTALESLESVEPLVGLEVLGVSDCRVIESLTPVAALERLEKLFAWGSTRIADRDLMPLMRLPRLRDVRMQDRREYVPRVSEIKCRARRPPEEALDDRGSASGRRDRCRPSVVRGQGVSRGSARGGRRLLGRPHQPGDPAGSGTAVRSR